MTAILAPARLRAADIVRVGGIGLRTRPLRAFLSALGIAIGIAAMVAVAGISSSSRAELDRQLAALGTNLLTVSPGRTFFGENAKLPLEAEAMIDRIGPVTAVTATGRLSEAKVYRSDRIPKPQTNGLTALAARTTLPVTVGATVHSGTWLNPAIDRYPAVVLGSTAAQRLGIGRASPEAQILIDALAARQATSKTFTGLLLGLGAVALLVGGVGVANTMVISVLERRAEIGLRRSLGATRGQVRMQFLAESLLLSLLGGVGGILLGATVTAAYALYQTWPAVVPTWALAGGIAATVVIGGIAGLYPAIRASRLSPTEALAAT
jgi:putative ABC transport system permease protein